MDLWWDASSDPDTAGYVVYYGPLGSPSPNRADVGNATFATLDNFQEGQTYFFYLTAYDPAHSETDPSTVLNYTVPLPTGPNTAPALGMIPDQTVTVTSNLTFTATASDADLPAQLLTFSLEDGAPSGASIDPASGVFSWTPNLAQIGTYPVTIRVTDNGSPALSATRPISITVNRADPSQAPAIALLPDRPGVFTLSFTNLPGCSYLVLTNADLGTTNWGALLSVPAAFNSGVVKLSQSTSNAAHLFYRVILLSN